MYSKTKYRKSWSSFQQTSINEKFKILVQTYRLHLPSGTPVRWWPWWPKRELAGGWREFWIPYFWRPTVSGGERCMACRPDITLHYTYYKKVIINSTSFWRQLLRHRDNETILWERQQLSLISLVAATLSDELVGTFHTLSRCRVSQSYVYSKMLSRAQLWLFFLQINSYFVI